MNYAIVIPLCCFAINLGIFAKDIYIPSMPAIADSMHCSAAIASESLTWFVMGGGLSQLIFGPLSDYIGRKKPILIGLTLCLVGNFLSIDANTIDSFLNYRLLAGIGAGACTVIPRTIASDLYQNAALTKAIATISMATVISTALAPWIGGLLQQLFNCHACFIFLTALTACCLAIFTIYYKETKPNSTDLTLRIFVKNSLNLVYSVSFLSASFLSIMAFSSGFIFLVMSPFIFQHQFSLSPAQNGQTYIVVASAYFFGAYIVKYFSSKLRDDTLIFFGLLFCAGSSCIMLAQCLFSEPSLLLIMATMFINTVGSGVITPVANKQGIAAESNTAGTAAALIGSSRLLGAYAITSLITQLGSFTPWLLASSLLGLALFGICIHALNLVQRYVTKQHYAQKI